MSPNRTVVAVLVALVAGQAIPGFASAQGGQLNPANDDVYVERVDYGLTRIAGVAAPINITIRNQGTTEFGPATGWQIFVGLNGNTQSACITKSQNPGVPETLQPCFIRKSANDEDGTIPGNGGSRTYTLMWNADASEASTNSYIWVEILRIADSPGTPEDCSGPDSFAACRNNYLNVTNVRIDRLSVRAIADRDVPPGGSTANVNDPWTLQDIPETAICPRGNGDSPQPVRRGCRTTPGTTLLTHFYVNNTGTIEDTYEPVIEDGSGTPSFTTRGYEFAFAPPTVRVNPGGSQLVKLTIYVPVNETAHEGMNIGQTEVRVNWRSKTLSTITTDTDSNVGCTANPCDDPSLPTFVVGQRYAFNITTQFTYDDANPAESSEFRVNLTNLGNAPDRFNATFLRESRTIDDSWNPQIELAPVLTPFDGQPLPSGATHSIRVTVTPPVTALNGTYWFDVAVRSRGDVNNAAVCRYNNSYGPAPEEFVSTPGGPSCVARFWVNVRQTWAISGTADLDRREVPGRTVTYDLVLRNEGNGVDVLPLNLASSLSGWDARLSQSSVSLGPGNTTTVRLTVTAPPNLPENTQAAFFVNTTASGPPELGESQRSRVSLQSNFTIARGPNIRLDAPTTRGFVDPGQTLNFTVTATNIGNIADNFTVPIPARPADWGITVDPPFREVQPGESFPITVSLRAPASAITGENATAALRVASTVDRSLDANLLLEGNISGPDLVIRDVLVNTTTPYTGDPLEVTVLYGNDGNKGADRNVTLRVFFVQGGVERLIGEHRDPTLGAQRRNSTTFTWDTSNVEGAGVLLARIDIANEIREMDESAASNEGTLSLSFRRFALRLDAADGQEGRPGEIVRYESPNGFRILYQGDDPQGEPVLVRVDSEHGWLTSKQEETFTLQRGTSVLIQPVLEIPRLPGTSRDTLTVTVTPTRRPAEVQRVSVTTEVVDEEKPLIRSITASPTTATVGQPVIITADVEDATGVTVVTAYVTTPTNQTSGQPMTRAPDGKWVLNGSFLVAGSYRVTAEASDAANPPNTNGTRLTVGTFTMLPGPGPQIKLQPGQSMTIRTGALVKVAITDPAGVAKASYTIRGVTYDLRAPDFAIDTSTFPNGTVAVNVTAENIHAVRSSQSFTFTVDNGAPGITSVALEPERPRSGDTVKVTIRADSDVQAITVAVKLNGNLDQTLNATKRTNGAFEVTFDAKDGDYRLDVTAKDLAGNAAVEDGAVVFSARPASPLPLPPWLAVVGLALVALALVRFRRS